MLAATLYLPGDLGRGERVPALLEYLPYRKDDDTAPGDYGNHAYFARHGYVGARVDIRGFGQSGGAPPPREYSAQEQQDGERVIAWLARQPWSNGKVGMLGISWGGFNSIQMAMRRPPALKAILAVEATEALFKEDVHYMDGIMHVDEFEVSMDLDQGRSAAPDFPLDEDTLAKRMDSTPWSLDYFRHQRDGAFWRAPIRRFEDIRIPCFLIGGLQDGYRDSIPRMLERVPAVVRAWIGPWNHDYPNTQHVRTAHRVARPGRPVVRPLAQGHRQRGRARTAAGHVPAAFAPAGGRRAGRAWRVARRDLAAAGTQTRHVVPGAEPSARAGTGPGGRRSPSLRAVRRPRSGLLVGRIAARSTAGRCVQPDLRQRAAGSRGFDARFGPCAAARCRGRAARGLGGAARRRRAGRQRDRHYRRRHRRRPAPLDGTP